MCLQGEPLGSRVLGFGGISRVENERILRALEEDREFRYALIGLVGFKEILDRIVMFE